MHCRKLARITLFSEIQPVDWLSGWLGYMGWSSPMGPDGPVGEVFLTHQIRGSHPAAVRRRRRIAQ